MQTLGRNGGSGVAAVPESGLGLEAQARGEEAEGVSCTFSVSS
jgi:hypothetical protein